MDFSREIDEEYCRWRQLVAEYRLNKHVVSLMKAYSSSYHILKLARATLKEEHLDGPKRVKFETIAEKMSDDIVQMESYAVMLTEGDR